MSGRGPSVDVIVVGGSLAGCAAAIRFAQMGRRVVVLERHRSDPRHHKRLCTHFLQPHAVPLLATLGVGALDDRDRSVRTKARFLTPGGVIDAPGDGYLPDVDGSWALNIERRLLDPALRASAVRHGVELVDGVDLRDLGRVDDGWQVDAIVGGRERSLRAPLLVAADGRQSTLARRLRNPTTRHGNDRSARFAYFSGIPAPAGDRSLFIHDGDEMAFVYPLADRRTLLSLYVERDRDVGWGRSVQPLLDRMGTLPEVPSLARAVAESQLFGYHTYPSLVRRPVWEGVAFVGDAALSLDPMSGVGCGFALATADLLARAFDAGPMDEDVVREGLEDYARAIDETIAPHVGGICGDSRIGHDPEARASIYRVMAADPSLGQRFLALTGRLILPGELQGALVQAMLAARATAARSAHPIGAADSL